ncbi:ABC transporter permease [Thiobaca trueperi]|uniref:Putative ABC transport system permease protein n=1 Tax=Thiobaca trueperi TaxID=127458 RepID=A0A4R3MXQ9_9GAMM|nr:ABC transporter permease [Thiobaca trueperi]TCT21164.1 putative ABC transport system permease protein [Thiobaca trueperi]
MTANPAGCDVVKYFPLLLAALLRKKTRTLLTLLSVAAAFTLFGMLDAVRVAFESPQNVAGIDRLIISSRLSLIQPLPAAYLNRIQSVPGVKTVTYASWFGGIYQDPKNFFPNFPVEPETYLDMYSELVLPRAQRQAFIKTRTGAVVGQSLADRFGWKVGDRIPLKATIFPHRDGGEVWTFDLVGIFHASEPALRPSEKQMLFHHDYFDEGRSLESQGTIGWYIARVDDPAQADRVAQAIDRQFANSAFETRTQSEREFQLSFAKQIGDIGLIVKAIMGAVFFTLVLLTGNTLAQSIRERIPELAVLKTIGFTNRAVLWLVLAESILLLLLGGLLGLILARLSLPAIREATGGQFDLTMQPETWMLGLGLMTLIGVLVGLPPALKAMRLSIVDALAGR